jgi:O-antigen ligase
MGKLSRVLLGLVLLISPLFLGSNRAVFWSINALIVAVALLFFVMSEWSTLKRSVSDWALPAKLLYLFVLPLLWMIAQIFPGMPSPLAHPIWQTVPEVPATISINPAQTLMALLWWCSMGVVFVALRSGTRRGGITFFLNFMLISAVVVALFGLANMFFQWQSVGIIEKIYYQGWLTGTFVNRNSAGSFFVIGLAIATVRFLDLIAELRKRTYRSDFMVWLFLMMSSRSAIYLASGVLLFFVLLLTGSRASLASGIIAVVIIVILYSLKMQKVNYKIPGLLFVILMIAAVFSTTLLERANGASSSWVRVDLALESLHAIIDRPLLGHGAGAYQSVEPLYRTPRIADSAIWNRAHNSYLEAAVTLGAPFVLLWLVLFAKLVSRLVKRVIVEKNFLPATSLFLALAVAEGLHGLVDFSLQIQAIAIFSATILGLACGEVMTKENEKPKFKP